MPTISLYGRSFSTAQEISSFLFDSLDKSDDEKWQQCFKAIDMFAKMCEKFDTFLVEFCDIFKSRACSDIDITRLLQEVSRFSELEIRAKKVRKTRIKKLSERRRIKELWGSALDNIIDDEQISLNFIKAIARCARKHKEFNIAIKLVNTAMWQRLHRFGRGIRPLGVYSAVDFENALPLELSEALEITPAQWESKGLFLQRSGLTGDKADSLLELEPSGGTPSDTIIPRIEGADADVKNESGSSDDDDSEHDDEEGSNDSGIDTVLYQSSAMSLDESSTAMDVVNETPTRQVVLARDHLTLPRTRQLPRGSPWNLNIASGSFNESFSNDSSPRSMSRVRSRSIGSSSDSSLEQRAARLTMILARQISELCNVKEDLEQISVGQTSELPHVKAQLERVLAGHVSEVLHVKAQLTEL